MKLSKDEYTLLKFIQDEGIVNHNTYNDLRMIESILMKVLEDFEMNRFTFHLNTQEFANLKWLDTDLKEYQSFIHGLITNKLTVLEDEN